MILSTVNFKISYITIKRGNAGYCAAYSPISKYLILLLNWEGRGRAVRTGTFQNILYYY